jgi:hypothetical protein
MIFFPRVGFLSSHDWYEVYLGRMTSEKWWRQRGGTGDGGGARVVARVYVWVKLVWGDVGEVHPRLYRGVGRVRKD